jgi:single-stranded DNA-binding protein
MPVANARLGQTHRLSRNELPAEHTNWFSLVFYGDLANLAMELDKGANVYVEGSFDQRPTTDQHGHKRYVHEVTVQKFFRIARPSNDARPGSANLPTTEALNDEPDSDDVVESVPWAI